MDCGRKIDRLTINVIVLRGAIRRDGIVVRRIVIRRAADSVHLLVRMKYRTAFSVTGRIAPAPKFRLGLADCELRSWDVLSYCIVHLHQVARATGVWWLIRQSVRRNRSHVKIHIYDFPYFLIYDNDMMIDKVFQVTSLDIASYDIRVHWIFFSFALQTKIPSNTVLKLVLNILWFYFSTTNLWI